MCASLHDKYRYVAQTKLLFAGDNSHCFTILKLILVWAIRTNHSGGREIMHTTNTCTVLLWEQGLVVSTVLKPLAGECFRVVWFMVEGDDICTKPASCYNSFNTLAMLQWTFWLQFCFLGPFCWCISLSLISTFTCKQLSFVTFPYPLPPSHSFYTSLFLRTSPSHTLLSSLSLPNSPPPILPALWSYTLHKYSQHSKQIIQTSWMILAVINQLDV